MLSLLVSGGLSLCYSISFTGAAAPPIPAAPLIPTPAHGSAPLPLSVPGAMPPCRAVTSVTLFSAANAPSSTSTTSSPALAQSLPSLPELEAMFAPHGTAPLVAADHKPQPLIMSSALPPIPGKVVERIRAGLFVDLKELLQDNVALLQRLQEVNTGSQASTGGTSRMRDIRDPMTWASAFMAFVAARSDNPETRDLLAYGQLVLLLARKHGGLGWVAYDHQFRQQAAAGSTAPWSELNLSLMAATVFATGGETPTRACPLCFAADHSARECALASLEVNKAPPRPPASNRTAVRPRPYRTREEVCRRFNRGACSSTSCKFEHTCSTCQQPGHGSHECRRAPSKNMTQEPATQPPRPNLQ